MRKAHRYLADVPQPVADRGTELIERHLAAYGVSRARDLPDEGKVYLRRELVKFFAASLTQGLPQPPAPTSRWRRWWDGLFSRAQRG
jgi:hypothetical protein